MAVAGCDSPTTPSADLNGVWQFTFSAFDTRSCSIPAGLMPGCAGGGQLEFLATAPIHALHSYRAACQSCWGASEYGAVGQPLPMARLGEGKLEFTLATCRFRAVLPSAPAGPIAGTAVCRPEATGPEISGTWTMSRP